MFVDFVLWVNLCKLVNREGFYGTLHSEVTKGSLDVTTLILIIRHVDDGEIGEGLTRGRKMISIAEEDL